MTREEKNPMAESPRFFVYILGYTGRKKRKCIRFFDLGAAENLQNPCV